MINMSLRLPTTKITRGILANGRAGSAGNFNAFRHSMQRASMASVVPPVTQNSMSAKGPTAMVFMNMGGPSSTDQVGDFLSRLFVGSVRSPIRSYITADNCTGGRRSHPTRSITIISWPTDIEEENAEDSEAICSHWWWLTNTKMVGATMRRDVQNIGSDIARDGSS